MYRLRCAMYSDHPYDFPPEMIFLAAFEASGSALLARAEQKDFLGEDFLDCVSCTLLFLLF